MAEYIERQKAIGAAKHAWAKGLEPSQYLEIIPAEYVAPVRHGRWLPQVVLGQKAWDCSECKTLGSPHWKWCPVCGCRMDLEV